MKIICIGNSIVKGFPLDEKQCWVSLWRNDTKWEIINAGVNGETTRQTLERFEKDVFLHHPDAVVIFTGTNELIYGLQGTKETMKEIKAMLLQLEEHDIETILLTPLLVDENMASERWMEGVDYGLINEQLKDLRQMMLNVSLEWCIKVIDLQTEYDVMVQNATAKEYYIDGVHPTLKGHEEIKKILVRNLKWQDPS